MFHLRLALPIPRPSLLVASTLAGCYHVTNTTTFLYKWRFHRRVVILIPHQWSRLWPRISSNYVIFTLKLQRSCECFLDNCTLYYQLKQIAERDYLIGSLKLNINLEYLQNHNLKKVLQYITILGVRDLKRVSCYVVNSQRSGL